MSENVEIGTRIELSDEELAALTGAIKTRFGIDFTCYEKKSLKRGFARLIARNQLGSLVGLWSKILKDKSFLVNYIDDLLVNLTELFRNPEIWVKIREDLLVKLKEKPLINVWHAGCSTGEEIYSMAICLKEAQLMSKCNILASDLSTTALETAKKGKYSKLFWTKYRTAFLNCYPRSNPEKYFGVSDDEMVVNEDLRTNIRFQLHNLVQDKMFRKFNVIFCRNVMIYFDDKLKMNVLKLFHEALDDDVFFIIGYYDMLPEAYKELFVLYDPTTRIYRKK